MRKGIKVLIVVVVAAATNFGLHAAFWSACGNGQCGPQNYNHHGYYQGGCNNQNTNCANPWGCTNTNQTPTDTTKN